MNKKNKLFKYLKMILSITITAIFIYLIMLFFGQNAIIYPGAYYDNPKISTNSVLQLQKIDLKGADNNSVVLYKLAGRENNPKALIMFHGNADTATNMLNRLYNPYVLYYGYDIYAMEYRGFDGVEGKPSEEKILSDSKIALDYIKSQNNYQTIVYYGHSLGCAIAVNLAEEEIPDGLVLEAPFSSLKDMAGAWYPFIPKTLINLMVKEDYNSLQSLKNIEIPNLLILNAKDDKVIPYQQGIDLYENAISPNKSCKTYETGGHNDIFLMNDIGILRDFLLKLN